MGEYYMGTGMLFIARRAKSKRHRVIKTASGRKLKKNRKQCIFFPRLAFTPVGNVPELKISVN